MEYANIIGTNNDMKLASEWLPRDMWRHEAAGRAEIPLWNATCWDPGLSQLDISPNIWCHSSKTIVWSIHNQQWGAHGQRVTPCAFYSCRDPGLECDMLRPWSCKSRYEREKSSFKYCCLSMAVASIVDMVIFRTKAPLSPARCEDKTVNFETVSGVAH